MHRDRTRIKWYLINGTKAQNQETINAGIFYLNWHGNPPYQTRENLVHDGKRAINFELEEHIEQNNKPMVSCLFMLGAKLNGSWELLNVHSYYEQGPITVAARTGNEEMCRWLINLGANINAPEYTRKFESIISSGKGFETVKIKIHYNALWHAVRNGHQNIVQLLLEHGINRPRDNIIYLPKSSTPQECENFGAMQEFLNTHGITLATYSDFVQEQLNSSFCDKIHRDYHEYNQIRRLIQYGAEVNCTPRGFTYPPLFLAAYHGWRGTPLVRILLENHADPNIKRDNGSSTALIYAIPHYDPTDICLLLLAYGADQLIQNKKGNTALIQCAKSFKLEPEKRSICSILIEHQKMKENRAVTLLLCLKHHEAPRAAELYRLSKHLLRPYLEHYTLKRLLNVQNKEGKTAYDYWPKNVELKPIRLV